MILAFDTSGPHVAVALLTPYGIDSAVTEMARGQAEALIPAAEAMLDLHNLSFEDLKAIGVGIGPGNFTGIRISVSAARGLALGLSIPAVGVSMFQTTAFLSCRSKTAVPAPRDQLYVLDAESDVPARMTEVQNASGHAMSSEFSARDHVEAVARLVAASDLSAATAPAPLYVKPADAAPPRDAPPGLIDA